MAGMSPRFTANNADARQIPSRRAASSTVNVPRLGSKDRMFIPALIVNDFYKHVNNLFSLHVYKWQVMIGMSWCYSHDL